MSSSEFDLKQSRIQKLLDVNNLDGLFLQRVSSFAWATCGASSFINTATTAGEASLLITRNARYLIANNIEAPRLTQEERLAQQGWELSVHPWYSANQHLTRLTNGLRLGSDMGFPGSVNVEQQMAQLRAQLTPEEGQRMRVLGKLSAQAMDQAIRSVRPGETEHEIAAKLANGVWERGAVPIVNLVATDDRINQFRHPPPTDKRLEHYAMLVLCARKWGLVCSVTRLIHFGRIPDELRRKAEAVADVDAAFTRETRPGSKLSDVFSSAVAAYALAGFPDEWKLHHQGGAAGYEPREYLGKPDSIEIVEDGQSFAWNPSITGVKSEDTILVRSEGNEILTEIPGFPFLRRQIDGHIIDRPAILEIL